MFAFKKGLHKPQTCTQLDDCTSGQKKFLKQQGYAIRKFPSQHELKVSTMKMSKIIRATFYVCFCFTVQCACSTFKSVSSTIVLCYYVSISDSEDNEIVFNCFHHTCRKREASTKAVARMWGAINFIYISPHIDLSKVVQQCCDN